MASNIPNPVYIYDLPFKPRRKLCDILDADRRWEDLGGSYMGYDITTLQLIGQAVQRSKSPTWELLNKYSEINGKIKNLFIMLSQMDHQRAMLILQPYVDEKYHNLLRNESNLSTYFSCPKKEELPRPSFSGSLSSFSSNQSSRIYSQASYQKSEGPSKNKDYSYSGNSKFHNDTVNMNQNLSSVALHSKMNVLDISNNLSKTMNPVEKKSPDMRSSKKSSCANYKAESMTDNCVSEKIKNVRKSSIPQDLLLNGKLSHHACGSNLSSLEETLPDIMQILYKDISKATNNFNKGLILGQGGFGTVYKGEWKGTSVAIKRLTPRGGHDSASKQLVSLKQSLNELSILKCCRFDHILPLYGVSLDGEHPCLVYQLMSNGSLEDWLVCRKNTPPLSWSQRSHIAECTTKGLNYLHTIPGKPLVHGDIKSANILLDVNMDAKIGDFGLTREGPGCEDTHVKVSSLHGTECYLPLEYLRHRHLSPQVDIYSYGIVLLEMATGLRPYDLKRGETKHLVDYVNASSTSGRLDALRDTKAGEENMIWFRELLQIGQKCSSKEKKKRPPMNEVLEQFEKIKEEMSMMEKIRRLSNDKEAVSCEACKLVIEAAVRKLSPIELQIFYDLRKDGQSSTSGNEVSVDSHPVHTCGHNVQGHNGANLKDAKVFTDSISSPEIRDSTSSDYSDTHSSFGLSQFDDSRDTSADSVTGPNICQNVLGKNDSSDGKAPLPLLTVLQLQVSEFNCSDSSINNNNECLMSDVTSDLNTESLL